MQYFIVYYYEPNIADTPLHKSFNAYLYINFCLLMFGHLITTTCILDE